MQTLNRTQGRMRFAKSHAAGNPVVQEYRYNGLGHQIARRFDANLDGVVDSSDPWRHSLYNERWQEVGVWHGSESLPREVFVMHAAGRGGFGSSSYVDHVILRDRDYRGGEADPENDPPLPDGILEERRYVLQNWRYDVIAVVASNGSLIERRRYDAYGRPISVSPADVGAQGGVEGTDGYLSNNDGAAYNTLYFAGQVKWSTDLADGTTRRPNGTLNSSDYARFNDYFNEGYAGGLGLVSDSRVDLRRGYAGYQYDEILAGSGIISDKVVSKYHVRNRVLSSDDGKWNRRDPLGFVDGMGLYEYVSSGPMSGVDPMGLRRDLCQIGFCSMSRGSEASGASLSMMALSPADCPGIITYHPNVANSCHCRAPGHPNNGKFVSCPTGSAPCPLPGTRVPAKSQPGQCRCTIGGHFTDCKPDDGKDKKPNKRPKKPRRPGRDPLDMIEDVAECAITFDECLDKAHNDYVNYLGFCTARTDPTEQQSCFDAADSLYLLDAASCTAEYTACSLWAMVPRPWEWFE